MLCPEKLLQGKKVWGKGSFSLYLLLILGEKKVPELLKELK